MPRIPPLPDEAQEELKDARAHALRMESLALDIERLARQARARADAARASYDVLLEQHAGQMSLLEEID